MKPAILTLCLLALVLFTGCSKKTTEADDTVSKPRFLPAGGTYEAGQYMSIQCATEDAEIRYTLDTTEPTQTSPLYTQSLVMPDFFINHSNYVTVKAKAFRSDLLPSATATATYTVNYANTVAAPVFNPAEGSFNYSPIAVQITCATVGAQIRYTTDGTEPTYASNPYTPSSYVAISSTHNIKARAFKDGWNCSAITSTNITHSIYQTGHISYSSPILDVAIQGDYAYLADNGGALRIIDISDPNDPVEVTSLPIALFVKAVAVQGSYAYLPIGSSLFIVDISDPANPFIKSSVTGLSSPSEIEVRGDYAYVTDVSAGLKIFNISDPAVPVLTGSLDTPGYAYGLCLNGDYAYVADGHPGIRVIDISNPASPVSLNSVDTPGMAYDITINGSYAYVADFAAGISVYYLPTPSSFGLVHSIATPDLCLSVKVSGDRMFSAEGGSGMRVFDLSNPANPTLLGYCGTDAASELQVVGSYIYVADDSGGFRIILSQL